MAKNKDAIILLAEDDVVLSRALILGLKQIGARVVHATDGVEAMEKIRAQRPTILVLDILMPKKDGFAVLEEMAADADLKKIPVLVLSNYEQNNKATMDKYQNVNAYFVKSHHSMQEVIEKVASML